MMSTKHDKIVNTQKMYLVLRILCAVSFRYMYLILQDTGRHQCYIMEFRQYMARNRCKTLLVMLHVSDPGYGISRGYTW